jgi:hypothetical protein
VKITVDEEAVKNLDRSLSIIPQIYSIVRDPVTREVISGVHRQQTGKASKEFYLPDGFIEGIAKKLGALAGSPVTREMAVVVLRQHLNVQRQPSEEETRDQLLELAKGFEAMGVQRQLIAQKVVKVSGLSERRTLELLPDEYKNKAKVEAGRAGGVVSAATSQQKRQETEQGVAEEHAPTSQAKETYSKVSPRQSEHRRPTFTEPVVAFANALQGAGVELRLEEPFPREGEFTQDGKPKFYSADILLLKRPVIIEGEGRGSSSSENEERDAFFKERSYAVVHLSNAHLVDYGYELADLIKALISVEPGRANDTED